MLHKKSERIYIRKMFIEGMPEQLFPDRCDRSMQLLKVVLHFVSLDYRILQLGDLFSFQLADDS